MANRGFQAFETLYLFLHSLLSFYCICSYSLVEAFKLNTKPIFFYICTFQKIRL